MSAESSAVSARVGTHIQLDITATQYTYPTRLLSADSAVSARVGYVYTYICSHVCTDKQKLGRRLIALSGEL